MCQRSKCKLTCEPPSVAFIDDCGVQCGGIVRSGHYWTSTRHGRAQQPADCLEVLHLRPSCPPQSRVQGFASLQPSAAPAQCRHSRDMKCIQSPHRFPCREPPRRKKYYGPHICIMLITLVLVS